MNHQHHHVVGATSSLSSSSTDNHNNCHDNNGDDKKKGITHTMQPDSYRDHSVHQYDAHRGCQHLLEGVLGRWAKRIQFEDQYRRDDGGRRRRHLADLGSADGTNSMRTLQWAIQTLRRNLSTTTTTTMPPLHVTFEEHPASDEACLRQTLEQHHRRDWFQSENTNNMITYSVLMRSFYEPLFEPESVDLLLCYICLHWLDSNDTTTTATTATKTTPSSSSVSEWKSWSIVPQQQQRQQHQGSSSDDDTIGSAPATTTTTVPPLLLLQSDDFVFMNEATVPSSLQDQWRNQLAKVHLAKFFALRARELRPGAEGIVMMVGQPNGYVCPPSPRRRRHASNVDNNSKVKNAQQRPQPSALTMAMQHCAEQGLLRREVLEQALVPYYLRTVDDIRDAFDMASTIPVKKTTTTTTMSTTTTSSTVTTPDDNDCDESTKDDNGDCDDECDHPGSLLALVDVISYPINVGSSSITGAFDMFWSIHAGAIMGAGATEMELQHVQLETRQRFHDLYSSDRDDRGGGNIWINYVACVIRRRTRKARTAK